MNKHILKYLLQELYLPMPGVPLVLPHTRSRAAVQRELSIFAENVLKHQFRVPVRRDIILQGVMSLTERIYGL